jgi:hypothetical protein
VNPDKYCPGNVNLTGKISVTSVNDACNSANLALATDVYRTADTGGNSSCRAVVPINTSYEGSSVINVFVLSGSANKTILNSKINFPFTNPLNFAFNKVNGYIFPQDNIQGAAVYLNPCIEPNNTFAGSSSRSFTANVPSTVTGMVKGTYNCTVDTDCYDNNWLNNPDRSHCHDQIRTCVTSGSQWKNTAGTIYGQNCGLNKTSGKHTYCNAGENSICIGDGSNGVCNWCGDSNGAWCCDDENRGANGNGDGCISGLECNSSKRCQTICGDPNEPCCSGDSCNSGAYCNTAASPKTCIACSSCPTGHCNSAQTGCGGVSVQATYTTQCGCTWPSQYLGDVRKCVGPTDTPPTQYTYKCNPLSFCGSLLEGNYHNCCDDCCAGPSGSGCTSSGFTITTNDACTSTTGWTQYGSCS